MFPTPRTFAMSTPLVVPTTTTHPTLMVFCPDSVLLDRVNYESHMTEWKEYVTFGKP